MKLWPHQRQAVQTCLEALQRPRSYVLVQFPTGSGKSEVAITVALEWLRQAFSRVLLVVPTRQILEQFVARLAASTRERIFIEQAGQVAPYGARLVVASQNSLWERLERYNRETLCIFDECHHANLEAPENLRIASSFAHVIGLSASPWSQGCEALFSDAARVTFTLSEAQACGFVAPLEIEPWCEPTGPHGLVFCGTNADAEDGARLLPGASWVGVNSGEVEQRVASWRAGRHPVLFVNRMLSEGFDEKQCARVWLDVESDSDIRYVQMAGRALRVVPGKVARLHCRTRSIERRLLRALQRAGL